MTQRQRPPVKQVVAGSVSSHYVRTNESDLESTGFGSELYDESTQTSFEFLSVPPHLSRLSVVYSAELTDDEEMNIECAEECATPWYISLCNIFFDLFSCSCVRSASASIIIEYKYDLCVVAFVLCLLYCNNFLLFVLFLCGCAFVQENVCALGAPINLIALASKRSGDEWLGFDLLSSIRARDYKVKRVCCEDRRQRVYSILLDPTFVRLSVLKDAICDYTHRFGISLVNLFVTVSGVKHFVICESFIRGDNLELVYKIYPRQLISFRLEKLIKWQADYPIKRRKQVVNLNFLNLRRKIVSRKQIVVAVINNCLDNNCRDCYVDGMMSFVLYKLPVIPFAINQKTMSLYVKYRLRVLTRKLRFVFCDLERMQHNARFEYMVEKAKRQHCQFLLTKSMFEYTATPAASALGTLGRTASHLMELLDEFLSDRVLKYWMRCVPESLYYACTPDEKRIDEQLELELVFLARDRRRAHYKSKKELKSGYKIYEGNFSHNVNVIRKAYNKGFAYGVKLYGRTTYDTISLPFPVYCDFDTFHHFISTHEISREQIMRWTSGDFTSGDLLLLRPLFHTVLHSQVVPTMCADKASFSTIAFCFIVSQICYFLCDEWVKPLFFPATVALAIAGTFGLKHYHFLYAVYEEFINGQVGVLPIIGLEFGTRGAFNVTQQLCVVVLHIFLSLFPFPIRVLLHYTWNNCILNHEFALSAITPERLAITSSVLDLVRKMYHRDTAGVILWIGMHCTWLQEALEEECIDIPTFISDFAEPLETSDGELSLLNSVEDENQKTKYDFLFYWVPISIKKSPTFKKMIAFLIMLFSTSFFHDRILSTRIGSYLSSDDFTLHGNVISIVTSTFSSMVKAVDRVVAQGSLSAIWDLPYDVYFVSRATEILMAPVTAKTSEEVMNDLADARGLLNGVLYSKKTPEMSRLCDKLEKYIVDKREFLENQLSRDQPMAIFLIGGPGSGKTTLMDLLCDFLARLKGLKRFEGDVIKCNVQDKFPVSTGAHPCAHFLFLNDIPNIYTDFEKRDLLPLDILLQQIIDTFPLSFRQAAVEMKGKLLKSIKFVIITSNHYSYVCPGETEKLQRRLEYGALLDMRIVKNGVEVKNYEEVAKMSVGERNDHTRFEILNLSCVDKRIIFKGSQKYMNLSQALNYIADRSNFWDQQVKKTSELFSQSAIRCDCGMPIASHLTSDLPTFFYDVEGTNVYQALTERCNKFLSEPSNLPPTTCGVKIFIPKMNTPHSAALSFSVEYYMLWALFFTALFNSKWIFKLFDQIIEYYVIDNVESKVSRVVLNHPLFDRICQPLYTPRTQFYIRAFKFYNKCKAFLLEYKWVIGGGALLVVGLRSLIGDDKEWEELSKPIYSSEVDPKSMNKINYRSEINYPVEKAREWGKKEMEMTVGVVQTGGVSGENLGDIVQSNVFDVIFRSLYEDETELSVEGKILAMSPEYIVFNKHYIPKDKEGLVNRCIEFRGQKFYFDDSELKYNDDNEFYLWKHNLPICVRGLQKFLPLKPIEFRVEVSKDGKEWKPARPLTANLEGKSYKSLAFQSDEVQGDCATPYLARVVGSVMLAGAVSAGDKRGTVVITLFSKEWLDALTQTDPFPFVEDLHMLGRNLSELSLNSEGRNVISPFLIPLGSDNLPGRTFTSKFRKSKLFEDVAPLLSEPYDYPRKTRVVTDGEYHSAFTQTFRYLNLESNLTRTEALSGVKMMVHDVFNRLPANGKNMKVSFLSLDEAIFGNPELGIDRINFKTSCGRELRQSFGISDKYDLFSYTEGEQFPYALKEEVGDLLVEIDSRARNGICEIPFVEAAEKDELRPVSKLVKAKIRLFSVLNAVFNLYGRMGLMPFITILLQNPQASECYGAMNAGSAEWDNLAKTILRHDEFGDLDFSSFDVCHYDALYIFAAFCYLCLLKLGMRQEDARACYIFLISLRWQLFYHRGDYYLKMKGMPSGVIVTLIMNSIVNSILFRIAYSRCKIPKHLPFVDNVILATVGDDNVNSRSIKISKYLDLLVLKDMYFKMGYVVTPAKKGSEFQKSLKFEDLTFLKRRFVESDCGLGYVAPIETDSIYKSMAFEKLDAGVSIEQRLDDVIRGAQREFFLHGKSAFEEFQNVLTGWERKHRCQFTRLEFADLAVEYKNKTFRTFLL